MNINTDSSRIIVTCSNRLSPMLVQELQQEGFQNLEPFKTGVLLKGRLQDCVRLNLRLRCASQVHFSLHKFRCRNADELYAALKLLPWENWIAADGYISVTSHVRNETINNHLFANVRVKDAIVDRFREKNLQRPHSGPLLDKLVFHLFWMDDEAEIFLDTSGETLSKHGYRKIPGKAPMIESLAAAVVVASNWNRHTAFVNPMCGSGTLAIEAALMASNRYPGLFRNNYSFMHLREFDMRLYEDELHQLKASITDDDVQIIASDISEDAINISKVNAGIAGVADMIRFEQRDFAETTVPVDAAGVVFFNPEYGDRLGVETALEATYKRMGDFMKQQCKGYTGYIFTGNLELAKKVGLKANKRIEFFNGKIDCRLLEYALYAGSRG